MKKLTTSVLMVVLSSSFAIANAQETPVPTRDSVRETRIQDVVITGALGLQKKAAAQTSAVTVLNNDQITQANNPNAILSLQGKVSGVTIANTNSSVSGEPRIVIRGPRSLTGNNQALIVIDNVISTAAALNQLPPELIESQTILKGAQAAALYGSDGVNGVVLVTTKRGNKSNRMTLTFNSSTDFESVAYLPKRQRLYGQGWSGVKVNVENGAWGPAYNSPLAGQMVPYGVPLSDVNGDGIITVNPNDDTPAPDDASSIMSTFAPYGKDNARDFFQTGTLLQNGITANVGNENGYFLMSVDHLQREFVVEDDKLQRLSAVLKGGARFNKWNFEAIVKYTRQKTSQTNSELYHDLLQSAADVPITRWKDLRDNGYAWNIYYGNPYWYIQHERYDATTNRVDLTGSIGYEFNDHIDALYRANMMYVSLDGQNYSDQWDNDVVVDATTIPSYFNKYMQQSTKYYGDLLINFDYDLTEGLGAKLTLGHNFQNFSYNNMAAGGTSLITPGVYTVYNVANPTLPYNLNNLRGSDNSQAVFANLDLNWRDYLFVTATAREEWLSSLPKENRNYFFPSVGVSFLPFNAFNYKGGAINYFKIYGSVMGTANASQVARYSIRNYYTLGSGFTFPTQGPTGGSLSFNVPTSQTDQNIRPEKVYKKELGVNMAFANNRITLGASIYQDDTKDMIINTGFSRASGIASLRTNIGKLRNKGLDADINVTPFKTADFRWDLGANLTMYKMTVLEVSPDADEVPIGGTSLVGIYAVKGDGFVLKGTAYQRDDQGRIVINATTGNPLYTTTLQKLGNVDPKYALGFNTGINYKGLRLSGTADWRIGGKFFAGVMQSMAFSGQLEESAAFDRTQGGFIMPNSVYLQNGVYVPNTSIKTGGTNYDGVISYYSNVYTQIGENFVKSSTFFKIREIALSYTIPKDLISSTGLSTASIGVHARNPFTKFSSENRNYADPETNYTTGNAQGYNLDSQYPAIRSFGFNVNLTF